MDRNGPDLELISCCVPCKLPMNVDICIPTCISIEAIFFCSMIQKVPPIHPFILRPPFLQFLEIWFEESGSKIVVDQKKRWFYTIDLAFLRLEKSG